MKTEPIVCEVKLSENERSILLTALDCYVKQFGIQATINAANMLIKLNPQPNPNEIPTEE